MTAHVHPCPGCYTEVACDDDCDPVWTSSPSEPKRYPHVECETCAARPLLCAGCQEPLRYLSHRLRGYCESRMCGGYVAGLEDGRERALLERDIAEVERASREWALASKTAAERGAYLAAEARFAAGIDPPLGAGEEPYLLGAVADQRRAERRYAEARKLRDIAADCERWLARARAVLGASS